VASCTGDRLLAPSAEWLWHLNMGSQAPCHASTPPVAGGRHERRRHCAAPVALQQPRNQVWSADDPKNLIRTSTNEQLLRYSVIVITFMPSPLLAAGASTAQHPAGGHAIHHGALGSSGSRRARPCGPARRRVAGGAGDGDGFGVRARWGMVTSCGSHRCKPCRSVQMDLPNAAASSDRCACMAVIGFLA